MIGTPTIEMYEKIIEAIPLDVSVLDKDDKVLGWNNHENRIFKRPKSALGNDVRNCHPKKSLSKVEQILDEMKEGKRDSATFYIDLPIGKNKEKNKVLIQYFAIRGKNGEYEGCLEASQNITPHQEIKGQKRLLD